MTELFKLARNWFINVHWVELYQAKPEQSLRLMRTDLLNSLAPGKFEWNFRYLIIQTILVIDGRVISCELALRWMSLDVTDGRSALVQVMAWCLTAPSHYLSQCWPRSLSPCGVTRPQWILINVGEFRTFTEGGATSGGMLGSDIRILIPQRCDKRHWQARKKLVVVMDYSKYFALDDGWTHETKLCYSFVGDLWGFNSFMLSFTHNIARHMEMELT